MHRQATETTLPSVRELFPGNAPPPPLCSRAYLNLLVFAEFFQKTATVTLGSRSSEDRPRRPVQVGSEKRTERPNDAHTLRQSRDSTLSPLATPPPRLPCHPIAPNVSDEMRRQHLKTCRVCARLSAQDAATASIAHRHSESDGSLAPNPSKKKYVCYVCARGFERCAPHPALHDRL